MDFLSAVKERILIADGAMGTLLAERGFEELPYSVANIQAPDLVRKIHEEYYQAGAEVIETNTFWSNRFRLEEHRRYESTREICLVGARLAREAAPGAFVLGAIGPCGKPLAPLGAIELQEAEEEFRIQAQALSEGGVDAIILETFSDLKELEMAVRVVRSVCDLPLIASKSFIEDGETLSEGLPLHVAREMVSWGVDVIGMNCVVGPQRAFEIVRWMAEVGNIPISAMPTPGMPQIVRRQTLYDTTPEYFGAATARLAEAGANIIGGCCGTTPEMIAALASHLPNRQIRKRAFVKREETTARKPLEPSQPSELSAKLGKKFIVTVEIDLPRGLQTDPVIQSAKTLKEAGADLIDISDGARARLRMVPMAISHLIQEQAGIEVMMHVACRDRNLLALQADLLGAHALGIRNVLPITGDPTNIGDFPGATSVFDIDSIGLVRVLSRMNEGLDMASNTIGKKCAFTIAVAFNPLAPNRELELDRLKRKADAGAHIIYTQPLFEEKHLEFAVESARRLGLPIFIGVLPLRHIRHAEFMHNEVPGISVPEWVRQRLREAPDDCALQVGIEIAQEFAQKIPHYAQGIYLLPPAGLPQIAIEVLQAVTVWDHRKPQAHPGAEN
jgi:methionine synthase I (cobalamin-dependent)/5,10-methylenetetrahydrofolate reductase